MSASSHFGDGNKRQHDHDEGSGRHKSHRSNNHQTADPDRHQRRRHHRDLDDEERDRSRKRSKREHIEEFSGSSPDDDSGENRHRRHYKSHKKSSRSKRYDDDDGSYEENRHHKSSSRKKEHKKSRKKKKEYREKKKVKKDSASSLPAQKNKPDKKFLVEMGKALGRAPDQQLDAERDYFSFHQHLWVYLHREEGLAFNDMTSEETREAFGRFVKLYNAGVLEEDYYDSKGLPAAALEEAKTTRHKWSFAMNEADDRNLQAAEAGVRKQTESAAHTPRPQDHGQRPGANHDFCQPAQGNRKRPAEHEDGGRDRRGRETVTRDGAAERAANRRLKEHVRTAEEEFSGGRKDGRERELEKKRLFSAKIHGPARDRESALELDDHALYGSGGGTGDNDFQAALAREKQRSADKRNRQESRVSELQAKEKKNQEEMLSVLGLANIKPGQKITIAPRNDAEQQS